MFSNGDNPFFTRILYTPCHVTNENDTTMLGHILPQATGVQSGGTKLLDLRKDYEVCILNSKSIQHT
jgi:hypothetical protein